MNDQQPASVVSGCLLWSGIIMLMPGVCSLLFLAGPDSNDSLVTAFAPLGLLIGGMGAAFITFAVILLVRRR